MTHPRSSLVSVTDTPWYHVVTRCVRRAFLCGADMHSGKNFDHRRAWISDWLLRLSSVFSIDVAAYAVMSNHYHVIVRVDVQRAKEWTVDEVLRRWTLLFSGSVLVQRFLSSERESMTEAEIERVELLAEDYRERLVNLSWFMRVLNENIARQANREDGVRGHFWESRFKSQALLDETALLSAMAYVDLNPIRAGMAETPEKSDHTSIQARIRALAESEAGTSLIAEDLVVSEPEEPRPSIIRRTLDQNKRCSRQEVSSRGSIEGGTALSESLPLRDVAAAPLMAFDATGRFEPAIPVAFDDYLELVDTVGRVLRSDKRGVIPATVPGILLRLDMDVGAFIEQSGRFLQAFGHAVGRPEALVAHAVKRQRKYLWGMAAARSVCGARRAA